MLRQMAALLLGLSAFGAVHASQVVLFDFEEGSLNGSWSANGRISVAREPDPVEAEGFAIRVEASGPSLISTQPGAIQEDFSQYAELRFRAYLPPEQEPTHIEVQLAEYDGSARFTRMVEIDQEGWHEYTVQLRWMSPTPGRLPTWAAIQRLVIQFPKPTNIHLDDLTLVEVQGVTVEPTMEELLDLAYPLPDIDAALEGIEGNPEGIAIDLPHVLLIAPNLDQDPTKLLEELAQIRAELGDELNVLRNDAQPILIVLPNEARYLEFCGQLAERYGRTVTEPASDGVTILGHAITYWDPEQGWERPTLIHEYVHSVLDRQSRLPSKSEWVQEGFANYFQIRFREPDSFEELYAALEENDERSSVARITTGSRIERSQYPRALSIIEFLKQEPQFRDRLPLLVETFISFGTTDLRNLSEPVLGMPLSELQVRYDEWLRARLRELRAPKTENGTAPDLLERSAHFTSQLQVEASIHKTENQEEVSERPGEELNESAEDVKEDPAPRSELPPTSMQRVPAQPAPDHVDPDDDAPDQNHD